jgi:hypothetical protein
MKTIIGSNEKILDQSTTTKVKATIAYQKTQRVGHCEGAACCREAIRKVEAEEARRAHESN